MTVEGGTGLDRTCWSDRTPRGVQSLSRRHLKSLWRRRRRRSCITLCRIIDQFSTRRCRVDKRTSFSGSDDPLPDGMGRWEDM